MSPRFAQLCLLLFTLAIVSSCSDEGAVAPPTIASGDDLAKGDNTVPFHFQIYNTIEIVGPPPPPVIHAIFPGHGRSHPFGPFTMYATSEIDVTVYPQIQTGDYVFTYRNGDELYASSVGEAIEDPPGTAVFYGDLTFTGGTGRFANASGSGTYEGTADVVAGFGQFTIDGTMSGFGGNGN